MSDCCTPGTGFPNSNLMQQLALNYPVIWEEICMIQQAILAASSQCQVGGGQMCTVVGGNTPMTFVTGVGSVTVVNGGSGYVVDRPAIAFIPPLGVTPSVPATASLITNGGNILGITVTDGGADYQPVPATLSVSSVTGNGAILEPLVNSYGEIVGVNIIDSGINYTLSDSIVATRAVAPNAAYVNASIIVTGVSVTGQITSVAVITQGTGYQPSVTTVSIVSELNPAMLYPLGTGFFGSVLTTPTGTVTQVLIENTGSGYSDFSPYLVITDPGTGAATSVVLSGTSVQSISVTQPGSNYTTSATGTVMNPPTAALPNPPATPAVVQINALTNTFGTNPNLYWNVWSGAATNKQIQMQMNQVISYFKGLGYTIAVQTNPATGSTIQWKICW